jgi:hypothetical protein
MSKSLADSYYYNSGGLMPRLRAERRSLLAMGMGIERQVMAAHAAEPPQQMYSGSAGHVGPGSNGISSEMGQT